MKIELATLLAVLAITACGAQHLSLDGWMNDLFKNINDATQNIQRNVGELTARTQQNVQHLTENIQRNVQQQLAEIDNTTRNITHNAGNQLSYTNGQSIVVSNTNGGTGKYRTIISGYRPDGQPYFRHIEQTVNGNVVSVVERTYSPPNNTIEEVRYHYDANNPSVVYKD